MSNDTPPGAPDSDSETGTDIEEPVQLRPDITDEEIKEILGQLPDAAQSAPDAPPPPNPPTPTVADDVHSMAELINGVAKEHRIKPDLAFKLLELTLNYKLAMRQLASAPPSFIPPYPTRPEVSDGDEAEGI